MNDNEPRRAAANDPLAIVAPLSPERMAKFRQIVALLDAHGIGGSAIVTYDGPDGFEVTIGISGA